MNILVGVLLLVTGTAVVLAGLALVVAEVIAGKHRKGGAAAHGKTMAGVDWQGMAALANGLAAIFKALADWPSPALLVLLGLIADGVGIWVLSVKPIT